MHCRCKSLVYVLKDVSLMHSATFKIAECLTVCLYSQGCSEAARVKHKTNH